MAIVTIPGVDKEKIAKNIGKLIKCKYSHVNNQTRTKIKEIFPDFKNKQVQIILAESIIHAFLKTKFSLLSDILWNLYEDTRGDNFEMMLLSQLELCASVIKGNSKDKHESLQKFSYRLFKMTNEPLYQNISSSLKLKVEDIKRQLPENLRYLFFMPHFCLKNVDYLIFIYTSIYSDAYQTRRYVFLWTDNGSADTTSQIGAQIQDIDTNSGEKLKENFKGYC